MLSSKTLWVAALFAVSSFHLSGAASTAAAGDDQFDQLAKKLVTVSAKIEPGNVVMIFGGKHTMPLMEAIAIEAQKAGGMVTMMVTTDRVARSYNVDVPEKYLDQEPRYLAEWLKHVDVFIGLPNLEDVKAVIADVPEARFVKGNKAGQVVNGRVKSRV